MMEVAVTLGMCKSTEKKKNFCPLKSDRDMFIAFVPRLQTMVAFVFLTCYLENGQGYDSHLSPKLTPTVRF